MIKLTAPQTYTATIGGVEWQNITPASYMWAIIQDMIVVGAEVADSTTPDPAAVLAAERANMSCSPLQGILTLGEANWNIVLAYRETAPWAEKVVIDSAQDWERNSQNIAFFGYLLNFTDDDMDALFRAAALVRA